MSATNTLLATIRSKHDENPILPTSKHSIKDVKLSNSDDRASIVERSSVNADRSLKLGTSAPNEAVLTVSSGSQSPHAENSLGFNAVTPQMRRDEKIVLAAMCFCLFLAGWNDGAIGPLLPRIQEVYGVGYAVVSVIFICACVGFISGSLANVYLTDRYNFGLLIIGGSSCQVVAYAIQSSAPPFPLFCIAGLINGFGISIQDAQANGLVASLHGHASEKMGLLHAIYGLGALASPLSATQFAQLPRWSFHFLVSLGVALLNVVVLVLTVKGRSLEAVLKSIGSPIMENRAPVEVEMSNSVASSDGPSNDAVAPAPPAPSKSSMQQILRNVTVQLMAVYILVYVGVEVTIGGWIVTFIINERGGGPSSGYISSGFFGGLMFGRVALLWVNKKIGERRVVFVYAALAIALEVVIWQVPSLIGNAVAVSIIGILLGPMYPLCMNHAARIVPRSLLTGSIGWIAGFGQAGSAILPFMTGALASRFGIIALQPLLVSMMVFMTLLWALVPSHSKRRD